MLEGTRKGECSGRKDNKDNKNPCKSSIKSDIIIILYSLFNLKIYRMQIIEGTTDQESLTFQRLILCFYISDPIIL